MTQEEWTLEDLDSLDKVITAFQVHEKVCRERHKNIQLWLKLIASVLGMELVAVLGLLVELLSSGGL